MKLWSTLNTSTSPLSRQKIEQKVSFHQTFRPATPAEWLSEVVVLCVAGQRWEARSSASTQPCGVPVQMVRKEMHIKNTFATVKMLPQKMVHMPEHWLSHVFTDRLGYIYVLILST